MKYLEVRDDPNRHGHPTIKADPEKKRTAERERYHADPEKKRSAKRESYQAEPEKKQTAERERYHADPEKKRSAKRKRYWESECARLTKRVRYGKVKRIAPCKTNEAIEKLLPTKYVNVVTYSYLRLGMLQIFSNCLNR